MNQLAQTEVLMQRISSTTQGSFLFHRVKQGPTITCVDLIAISTCQAQILPVLLWKCRASSMLCNHLGVTLEGCVKFLNRYLGNRSDCIWTGSVSSFREDRKSSICHSPLHGVQEIGDTIYRVLWQRVRLKLPWRERKANRSTDNVTVLWSTTLPAEVKVLQKGPKFSMKPSMTRPELLAMVRRFEDRVGEQNKERVIGDVADSSETLWVILLGRSLLLKK